MTLLNIYNQFGYATDEIETTLELVKEFAHECDGEWEEINLLQQRMQKFLTEWKQILGENLTNDIDCELEELNRLSDLHDAQQY